MPTVHGEDRKLGAINDVLTQQGMSKVTALGQTRSAQIAEDILDRLTGELQYESWYFNTDRDVLIPPSFFGYIYLPNDVVHVDTADKSKEVTIRGRRLYNLTDQTFDWTAPSNLLTNGQALGHADWTTQNMTVATNIQGFRGPHDMGEVTERLADTSDGVQGHIQQTMTDADFTNAAEYDFSWYIRNGRDVGSPQGLVTFVQNTSSIGTLAWNLDLDPPSLRQTGSTAAGVGHGGLAYGGELIVLDEPNDDRTVGAPWCFLRFKLVYSAGLGTPLVFRLQTDTTNVSPSGGFDAFVTGVQGTMAGVSPVKLDLVRRLEFHDLPVAAQAYIRCSCQVDFNDSTVKSPRLRDEFKEKREQAYAMLLKEETAQADVNMLEDSFSVSRIFGRGRRRNPLSY